MHFNSQHGQKVECLQSSNWMQIVCYASGYLILFVIHLLLCFSIDDSRLGLHGDVGCSVLNRFSSHTGIWNWSAAPLTGGGYREGESENSDRDGREGNRGNGDFQWRNGLTEKKKKVS